MPSKTDQLIESISKNIAFTAKWPYDEKKPLDSLPWYAVWLGKQARLMDTVAETADNKVVLDFCVVLDLNEGFMRFLGNFRITHDDLIRYSFDGFPAEERQNLFRYYRIWIGDQFALMDGAMDEGRIQKALGAENRQLLRDNLEEVGRVIFDGRVKKGEVEKAQQGLEGVKAKTIEDLKLGWNPKSTSVEKVQKELDRQIQVKETELQKKEAEEKAAKVPKNFVGTKEDYAKLLHAQCESVAAQVYRLLTLKSDLLEQMHQVLLAGEKSVEVQKKGKNLLQTTQKGVQEHVSEVAKGKKGLEGQLTTARGQITNEMERLYAELNPLLYSIADLNNEILVHESFLSRVNQFNENGPFKAEIDENKRLLKEKEQRLAAMYDRKDEIFLRIGHLQEKVNTLKSTYETQLTDERQFEEDAKHQLNLLKQIPRIEQALNIYCSSYKGSFPLFLYVGSFVSGDGEILHSPSVLGKGMDLLLKLPMVGAGLTDIEKCKAYDTGSMTLSLKLGLSVGIDEGGFTAKAGLAVEYNAGLSSGDDRTFQTVSEFVLKAAAKFEIPEIFHVALELEIAKWKGGFIFQDQYHWAAWLAARWGHFCAKARACDVYLSEHNIGPDHRPDQKALAELDRLAEQILNDNELIQTVYTEIRQYLDYPVIRSKQNAYFESGKLNVGLLALEVETEGNFRAADLDMMIVENENGRAVEYEATYHSWDYGGSITLGKYTVQISYEKIDKCPITINDGVTINVQFSPLPAPEAWVMIFDLFLGVLTGDGDIPSRLRKLFTESFKVALQTVIKKYAADYVLEKTKSMEFNFFMTQGTAALQYVRTRVEFGKKFETSVPVYEFIYVDLGAEFNYVRTFNEALGWNSTTYPQFVHHGFMGVPKQRQPMGKPVYTLRPDSMSGEELWKKFVEAHKHDLWHLFMAIGNKQDTVRKELAEFKAQSEVQHLIAVCEEKATSGRFKLTTVGLAPYIQGFFGAEGQVVTSLLKHTMIMKDKSGFEEVSVAYGDILPSFNNLLNAEYRHIKQEENSQKKARFRRVEPPPKTVQEEVGSIFHDRDDHLAFDIGWASQLQMETGKDMKSCVKCVNEVRDYNRARDLLLPPILPEKYWVADEDVSCCTSCKKVIKAGIFSTNKHHCRICGGIFCDTCCPSRAVPREVSKSKIRVCPSCFNGLGTRLNAPPLFLPQAKTGALPGTKTVALQKPTTVLKPETVTNSQVQSLMQTGEGKNSSQPRESLLSIKKEAPQPFKPKNSKVAKQSTNGGKKPGKPGPRDWYTDDQINWLMEHYLGNRQDTSVVDGISAHLHGGGTLRTNLQDRLEIAFTQGHRQMVVPVNVHENHWVGVYIHFRSDNYLAPDILHVDPQGNEPANDVAEALTGIFPAGRVNVNHTRYQVVGDGINCGPWVVALLEYLAGHNGTLPALNSINIGTRRTQDGALM